MNFLTRFCTAVFFVFCIESCLHASMVGMDVASDLEYSGSWDPGDNGGSGFSAWSFGFGGSNSRFIQTSTQGTGANIDSSGVSFGLFAGSGGFINAERSFAGGALSLGQTFSLDLSVNFRNGDKGISLFTGAPGSGEVFNFNVGSDDYRANGISIGNTYSDNSKFTLSFTQDTATAGSWAITRSGGVNDFDSGTYMGVLSSFRLYSANTDNGDANNLYFNNLATVPEPASLLTFAICVGYGLRRRRLS